MYYTEPIVRLKFHWKWNATLDLADSNQFMLYPPRLRPSFREDLCQVGKDKPRASEAAWSEQGIVGLGRVGGSGVFILRVLGIQWRFLSRK